VIQPLLIASHNKGKAKEIASLLQQYTLDLSYSWDVSLPEIDETGTTFIENAVLKAQHAANETGIPSIADDCGLELEYLGNKPGINSKRFAKSIGSWEKAMWHLVDQIEGCNKRAYFSCAIAMAWPTSQYVVNHYRLKGVVVPPRGKLGFGFDPCFLPDTLERTLGELEPKVRNKINHRAKAFELLRQRIDWSKCQLIKKGYSQ
jgi:XTP/dITP diphosphohydrolase